MCDVTQHLPRARNRQSVRFQVSPVPIPVRGWNPLASDIFEPDALQQHLQENSRWIRARPKTTRQIHNALFPDYDLAGMDRHEVTACLNAALEEEGYTPSNHSENPTWT